MKLEYVIISGLCSKNQKLKIRILIIIMYYLFAKEIRKSMESTQMFRFFVI